MSKEFRTRSIDEEFTTEIEDAWRTTVQPALLEIRETLAEHSLLTEAASIVLGDPRRIATEAGAVLAVSMGGVMRMSEVLLAAATAGLPTLDVLGRALAGREAARRNVAKNSFYFLHRLDQPGRR